VFSSLAKFFAKFLNPKNRKKIFYVKSPSMGRKKKRKKKPPQEIMYEVSLG
jgi:hypothetical protein